MIVSAAPHTPMSDRGAACEVLIDSARLPRFTFVAADGAERVADLSRSGGAVLPTSRLLSQACAPGAVVGIMGKPGPALIHNWLAAVHAGLRPLIMQYPTPKQSAQYWETSVRSSVEVAGVAAILADDATAGRLSGLCPIIAQADIDRAVAAAGEREDAGFTIGDYGIVQLSSGTTGHRKAVEFPGHALARHTADFNAVLDLRPERDMVASWLPLYHDMGYVACFVMPMLLGVPVVMMDPIDWVQRPELLFEAIAKHRATICYMPNFGYEVMARRANEGAAGGAKPDIASMRWWVATSEPISAATGAKFLEAVGGDPSTFAPLYGMAENIFAMTIRRGIVTAEIDGTEVLSCGPPIPGVEMKIVDEEIWIRSPISIRAYMNGTTIAGDDGYYPTGDLGRMIDGEIFVSGRKGDLLIQAGRKFMLSDIDLALNRLRPEVKGRGVAVQVADERLGTGVALVLIEAIDFFERADADEIAAALSAATDIDQLRVAFVPPRFLTKTSSGKFSRKRCAADWLLHRASRAVAGARRADVLAELRGSFAKVDWSAPVGEVLDSLSLTVLRIIVADARIGYDADWSLDRYAAAIEAEAAESGEDAAEADVIHIVSLADRKTLLDLTGPEVARLERFFKKRVTFEHICLPPSPVLLSDMVFADWFGPRLDAEPMQAVTRAIGILRSASILLVDDVAEFFFSPRQVYGVLSHNLERDPRVDQIATRWQRYAQHHDQLPLTIVAGADLPYAARDRTIAAVGAYLGKPVFRIATIESYGELTADWEYRAFEQSPERGDKPIDVHALLRELRRWTLRLPEPVPVSNRRLGATVTADDLNHFCSHFVDADAMEQVIARYDRFCIAGQPSSIPYLPRRLAELGKTFVRTPSYARELIEPLEGEVDAILSCGPQGRLRTRTPLFGLMSIGGGRNTAANVDDPELAALTFVKAELPASGTDWFHLTDLDRTSDWTTIRQARLLNRDLVERKKIRLAAAREERRRGHETAKTERVAQRRSDKA